jgi:hypothetical protein
MGETNAISTTTGKDLFNVSGIYDKGLNAIVFDHAMEG